MSVNIINNRYLSLDPILYNCDNHSDQYDGMLITFYKSGTIILFILRSVCGVQRHCTLYSLYSITCTFMS